MIYLTLHLQGTFEGSSYYVSNSEFDWGDAKIAAENGWWLFGLNFSIEENNFIQMLM